MSVELQTGKKGSAELQNLKSVRCSTVCDGFLFLIEGDPLRFRPEYHPVTRDKSTKYIYLL